MIVFVPIRTLSARDMEELRLATTSATRFDFVANDGVEPTASKLVAALATALLVPPDALERTSSPECLRVVGRTGLTETLVEAKVFSLGAEGTRAAVQMAATSRDRLSPTLAIFALSFFGMAVGFFGSFALHLPPAIAGIATCAFPFMLALPYMALRKRSVEGSSKAFYTAFRGVEVAVLGER